jgi:hypothetical protein
VLGLCVERWSQKKVALAQDCSQLGCWLQTASVLQLSIGSAGLPVPNGPGFLRRGDDVEAPARHDVNRSRVACLRLLLPEPSV